MNAHIQELTAALAANRIVDSDHPDIIAFAKAHEKSTPRESAVALYYAVRDRLRYNPWRIRFRPEDYLASEVLNRDPNEGGHCIDKALLLAAAGRALGIPTRLHFANVRNHIGTARLEEKLGTDLLVFHGYTELYLDHAWVAATPAFNAELCHKLGVAPLEFDGVHNSVFQEYSNGVLFMEYVTDHGSYTDIPLDKILAAWRTHYPAALMDSWSPSATGPVE